MTRSAKASSTSARSVEVAAEIAGTAVVLGETLWAAQQTIALRLMRLAETAIDPDLLRDPEFIRMVSEKLRAALEANLAVAGGMGAIADAAMEWASQQGMAMEQWALACWGPPDPLRWAHASSRYVETSLNIAEIACAHLALEATRLGGLGLKPYHKATNENARRLLRQLPALHASRA
ncbi:hypothetical protein GE253_16785 [Niveispirillum sp. SYP-B3756]|uniref:hypothetical protein n=1 Tax=Niveispirillum sp. SYP-B3756 TaxID=2662178 RepID=UPI0012916FB2|nr:hypothetical protein [Niveispirillum sp. SYP-B3756]MQP66985.1 hypothetical protein [Niveispirillum sp. SYP-B3756]